MRFFIALEIPSKNLAQLKLIQNNLHTLIPQAILTDIDKVHLTLAFLGEQPDSFKKNLFDIIKNAAQNIPPFEVTPAYIDGFPTLHKPQVLWVGVKGDVDKVLLLRERIKDSLKSLYLLADERRFVPHMTIAKFNNHFQVSRNLEVSLEKMMAGYVDPIKITSIKLFESVPKEGFHKHNTLAEIELA